MYQTPVSRQNRDLGIKIRPFEQPILKVAAILGRARTKRSIAWYEERPDGIMGYICCT